MKYTIHQAKSLLDSLSVIYEVVRLVDPVKHRMISFDENEQIVYDTYECYQVWMKQGRCKNCVSIHAMHRDTRMTKFEFVNDDIYHVVAKPVTIILKDGSEFDCTLEIVAKITDEILIDAFGKKEFTAKVIESEEKIYRDSLTKVYNRRYFDERAICHNDRCDLEGDVVFIMIDLKKFKNINDDYGHDIGDWVLQKTAKSIKANIRVSDSVIRLGGDEFLIVLSDCKEGPAQRIMANIQDTLNKNVVYDKEKNLHAIASFGIAATDEFVDSVDFISDLMKEADIKMYDHKQKQAAATDEKSGR